MLQRYMGIDFGTTAAKALLMTGEKATELSADAVSSGVVEQHALQTSIGTSSSVVTPIERPSVNPWMRIYSFYHAIEDTWYLMGVFLSAGAAYVTSVLAKVGSDAFPSVRVSCRTRIRPLDRMKPSLGVADGYTKAYERYRSLYPRLKPHFVE